MSPKVTMLGRSFTTHPIGDDVGHAVVAVAWGGDVVHGLHATAKKGGYGCDPAVAGRLTMLGTSPSHLLRKVMSVVDSLVSPL